MLSRGKCAKLEKAIQAFRETYLIAAPTSFDERRERHKAVAFLSDVLGFAPASDIRAEGLLKGPADFAVMVQGERHMLVGIQRPAKGAQDEIQAAMLRFAVIEGVNWTLFLDGSEVRFSRVLYQEPATIRQLFSVDLADPMAVKPSAQLLQFLLKEIVARKGLEILWNRTIALDPKNLAALLCTPPVIHFLQRALRVRSLTDFSETEVVGAVERLLLNGVGTPGFRASKEEKREAVKVAGSSGGRTSAAPTSARR